MKKRNAKFLNSAVQHIYQRAIDHGVIFYSIEDRLVYYTLSAVKSRKHKIRVCAASIMFTHTHQSCIAPSLQAIRCYLHDVDTSFSRLYNSRYKRTGRLMEKRPGCAQKNTRKKQRSNLIYVFNNHVEKGLCRSAVSERWSLIAYAENRHPFSKAINPESCSNNLGKAIRLVDRRIGKLKPLEYCDLERILPQLEEEERGQFVDYVISGYSWVDYSFAISEFGSLSNLILALDSTTGEEYDIKEEYSCVSDMAYSLLEEKMARNDSYKSIYSMSEDEKNSVVFSILEQNMIPQEQLVKFFHM